MKELAKEMAHSKDEQSRYNKVLRNQYYILIFFIYLKRNNKIKFNNNNNNNIKPDQGIVRKRI